MKTYCVYLQPRQTSVDVILPGKATYHVAIPSRETHMDAYVHSLLYRGGLSCANFLVVGADLLRLSGQKPLALESGLAVDSSMGRMSAKTFAQISGEIPVSATLQLSARHFISDAESSLCVGADQVSTSFRGYFSGESSVEIQTSDIAVKQKTAIGPVQNTLPVSFACLDPQRTVCLSISPEIELGADITEIPRTIYAQAEFAMALSAEVLKAGQKRERWISEFAGETTEAIFPLDLQDFFYETL